MDLEGLKEVLRGMESGRIRCIAVDTPVPSQFSHEILNANPYAYLDDAPLEERRARAVEMRGCCQSRCSRKLGSSIPQRLRRYRTRRGRMCATRMSYTTCCIRWCGCRIFGFRLLGGHRGETFTAEFEDVRLRNAESRLKSALRVQSVKHRGHGGAGGVCRELGALGQGYSTSGSDGLSELVGAGTGYGRLARASRLGTAGGTGDRAAAERAELF